MPYNGSGTFTPYTPGNPVISGTVISSTAFNATQSDIAAGLTNALTRDGQAPPTANLPMGGKKLTGLDAGTIAGDSLRWEQLFSQGTEQDIASAATTDIGAQNTTVLRITGTTGITSFGTNYNGPRFVRFADVLTLTHNASTLILPTSANITTAAGDRAILTPVGNPASGWQVLAYQRANGKALVETVTFDYLNTLRIDVASASTVDLTANAPNTRNINITGTTTITGFTVAAGQTYFVRFNAALTLTNNASIVTQTGANLITAAGDTCILRSTATNVVEVLSYVGYATSSQAGRVELSTDAEARAAASGTLVITPANLQATVLGINQVLTNLTGSRALNTTYTNGGKTIVVNIRVETTAGSGSGNYIGVTTTGGQQFDGSASGAAGAGWVLSVLAVIPPNSPYSANINNATLLSWKEMI